MKRNLMVLLMTMVLVSMGVSRLLAHCQIPCGIYDDPARFTLMEEHLTTIEKSINQIIQLSKEHDNPNVNQMVRWVNNKEEHVNQFTEIVTYYFMAQRIKPADANDKAATEKYVKQITLLHQMIVSGMKAKQTTDLQHVEKLRSLVKEFKDSYMGGK